MPVPRNILNAFPAYEASRIAGLSLPMIDCFLREGLLQPSYCSEIGRRGKICNYLDHDLVVARLFQPLCEGGIQLARLMSAVKTLCRNAPRGAQKGSSECLCVSITGGTTRFLRRPKAFLGIVARSGQCTFDLVINASFLEAEIRDSVLANQCPRSEIQNYLIFADDAEPVAMVARTHG